MPLSIRLKKKLPIKVNKLEQITIFEQSIAKSTGADLATNHEVETLKAQLI